MRAFLRTEFNHWKVQPQNFGLWIEPSTFFSPNSSSLNIWSYLLLPPSFRLRPLLGWVKKTLKCWYFKITLRTRWGYPWGPLETICWHSGTTLVSASHLDCQGETKQSGIPLGVTFGPEIENLCENHILWTFCILWEKNFVTHFSDFVYWKLPIFQRFWPKPVFAQIMKWY